jgi:hypothetical protein
MMKITKPFNIFFEPISIRRLPIIIVTCFAVVLLVFGLPNIIVTDIIGPPFFIALPPAYLVARFSPAAYRGRIALAFWVAFLAYWWVLHATWDHAPLLQWALILPFGAVAYLLGYLVAVHQPKGGGKSKG